MPVDLWTAWYGATGGAKGTDDLPANAWDNMAPASKTEDFDNQFADVRGLYDSAFRKSAAWTPTATAAQVGHTAMARDDLAARKYQDEHASRLAAIAAGTMNGAADPAVRASLANSMAANNATTVANTHGNALAGSMRALGNTNQGMTVGAENSIAQLKAQEQLAAEGALTPTLAGMRAQDHGAAKTQAELDAARAAANAGFKTQTSLASQDAALRQQQLAQAAFGAMTDHDRQQWQNKMAEKRRAAGLADWDDDLKHEREMRNYRTYGQGLGIMSDLTTSGVRYGADGGKKGYGYTSDERAKEHVRKARGDEFKAALAEYYSAAFGGH
jgi:hypothetical protein